MKGGFIGMKRIDSELYCGPRMSREVMLQRIRNVMDHELTEKQRAAVIGYYFDSKTMTQIGAETGVNKSTVCRTLHRAERKLQRFLRY